MAPTEPILHPDTLRLIAKKSPEYRAAFVEVARCEDAGLPHDDPRSIVAWARFGIAHNAPLLAHAEALLAGGVCTTGRRAGKPFDPHYRRRLEGWIERLRHILAFHARELRAVVGVRQRFVAATLATVPQRLARAIASLSPDEHAQLLRKSRAFIVARLKQSRRGGSPDAR